MVKIEYMESCREKGVEREWEGNFRSWIAQAAGVKKAFFFFCLFILACDLIRGVKEAILLVHCRYCIE